MPSASQLSPENRFMALFVGDSGSGKTPASCSWCNEGKVLDLDFDGRIRGILGCPWLDRSKIDYNFYPAVKPGLEVMFNRLNRDLELLQAQCNSGQNPYKTIVLSSLSAQQWLFLKDAISLTHLNGKGRSIGPLQMSDPNDFNFVSTAINNVLTFFRSLPGVNLIVEAHVIDKYEKKDPDDPYSPSVISGSKLALTDKLAAAIPGSFDHIFEFDRYMSGDTPKFRMRFWGDLARTVFPNMPLGYQDITNKDFYKFMHECIKKGQEKIGTNKNTVK
jgi:hypothetical protein